MAKGLFLEAIERLLIKRERAGNTSLVTELQSYVLYTVVRHTSLVA